MLPIPILLLIAAAVLLGTALIALMPRSNRSDEDWATLAHKLQPVETSGIAQIAESYLHPRKHQISLEPEAMYAMVGGLAGLNRMYENSKVMLRLAGYTARWNFEEAVIVTERIRRDALRLQSTILMIQLELLLRMLAIRFGRSRAAFRLEEAAAIYYRMTASLLALYETSHAGLYPRLAAVL